MLAGCKLNKIYRAGFCVGRGALAERTRGWKKVRFYARSFLLEHPQKGLILIDTGYGQAFLEATKTGMNQFYRKLLPVTYCQEDSVVTQLAQDGIALSDLSYLLITHFHPDHIGALPEFAGVPLIYRQETLHELQQLSHLKGLTKGFIHSLVPPVPKGSISIQENDFNQGWESFASMDLFNDGSLFLIDLPGHALGQMGVLTGNDFYVADANWGTQTLPHWLGFLIQENPKAYKKTFESLQKLPTTIKVIPTHTIEDHV